VRAASRVHQAGAAMSARPEVEEGAPDEQGARAQGQNPQLIPPRKGLSLMTSKIIAALLGPISAAMVLLNLDAMPTIVEELSKSPMLIVLAGYAAPALPGSARRRREPCIVWIYRLRAPVRISGAQPLLAD
jgi:hypothetical protein